MDEDAAVPNSQTATPIAKRFCMSHRQEVAEDKGCVVMRSGQRRWICFKCQDRSVTCLRTSKPIKRITK